MGNTSWGVVICAAPLVTAARWLTLSYSREGPDLVIGRVGRWESSGSTNLEEGGHLSWFRGGAMEEC
jgi:hypothetical protein